MKTLSLVTLAAAALSLPLDMQSPSSGVKNTLELPIGGYTGTASYWPDGQPNEGPTINLTIGTPPQNITFTLDTGSSDFWVHSKYQDCPTCRSESFDPAGSRSFSLEAKDELWSCYGDFTCVKGDYFSDTVGLASTGVDLEDFTMGLARVGPDVGEGVGCSSYNMLGLGLDALRSGTWTGNFTAAGLLEQMVDQGVIATRSYSLFFNQSNQTSGSVLFGGYDTSKFAGGNLTVLPLLLDTETGQIKDTMIDFAGVDLVIKDKVVTSWAANSTKANPRPYMTLDTGSDGIEVPYSVFLDIERELSVTNYGGINCDVANYKGGLVIKPGRAGSKDGVVDITVPFSELVYPTPTFTDPPVPDTEPGCSFRLEARGDENDPENNGFGGPALMKSMYTVYHQDEKVLGVAPAVWTDGGAGGVVPILPGDEIFRRRE